MSKDNVLLTIVSNINRFTTGSPLEQEIAGIRDPLNKVVVINNSFLFREKVQTTKSEKYLAFVPRDRVIQASDCLIVSGPTLKSDYQIMESTDARLQGRHTLDRAVGSELAKMGQLVYVLIGKIDENVVVDAELDDSVYKKVVLNPTLTVKASLGSDTILCQSLDDEEEIWRIIEGELTDLGKSADEIQKLKDRMAVAFATLKVRAFSRLIIPTEGEADSPRFLDLVSTAMESSLSEYEDALRSRRTAGAGRRGSLTEVLRIAYNFVDDAMTMVRLIRSVCDLKPVLLWGTFYSHYSLTEAIKNLPWARQRTKASITDYTETVKKARNKAFHKLLPFSKTLEVQLPDRSLKEATLRIFSEFGSKKRANQLTFQDKELVDVLMEFTRAAEEIVPSDFWEKNAQVMSATINLMQDTSKMLKTCLD